jgi:hypothetical protein
MRPERDLEFAHPVTEEDMRRAREAMEKFFRGETPPNPEETS